MEYFSLNGKVALVTGASRGIGAAIAQTYAKAGARVVLASRNQESVSAVAETIRKAGGIALPVAAHMGDPAAITSLVQQAIAAYGGIDIVVNNAATNPHFGMILQSPESAWDKALDVNLRSNFRLIAETLPAMEQRGQGKVINISSIAGLMPQSNMGLYCITKAATIMLTKVLAIELASQNIQVNAIAPGFIKTHFSQRIWDDETQHQAILERTPARRIASVDELMGTALYLASSASNFVTGQTIVVDGGLTL